MSEVKITPDWTIEDLVTKYPKTVDILFKHGIPAIACGTPIWGTIAENAEKYGVKDLDALMKELNEAAQETGTLILDLGGN